MSVEKDFLRSMVLLMAETHQEASFKRMEALMNDRAAIRRFDSPHHLILGPDYGKRGGKQMGAAVRHKPATLAQEGVSE